MGSFNLNTHMLEMYLYIYMFIQFFFSRYKKTCTCIAYISSHYKIYKGPEQDHLRSSFVPYVRNTAERSIHNFDSQPNTVILEICVGADDRSQMEHSTTKSAASLQVPQYVLEDALEKSGPRATQRFSGENPMHRRCRPLDFGQI